MKSFLRKLGWLARRPDKEAELREELQFHVEEDADQRRESGVGREAAHRAARLELGSAAEVHENTRAAWGWTRLEQLALDAAYGMRQIRRNPMFSALAIATLALGIGGITAIFSAFDAILIRPLPYNEPERLVMIWDATGNEGTPKHFPATGEWVEWRRLNTVFTDIAGTQFGAATLTGDSDPEQVPARQTTGNLWKVLGVRPLMGRTYTEEEDLNGARVAVIAHSLWLRRFGGSPDVVGRTITVNDTPYQVVGVMPRDFYFMPAREIEIWMPASFPPWMRKSFSWHSLQVVARLKPGVTLEQARKSMDALSRELTAKSSRGSHSVIVTGLREEMAGNTQTALVLLLSASAALLLIACVNLANLLMSRGTARGREVAVRAALGAGRGRLMAQFLTESLVLAGLGTALGLALAVPAMEFLELIVPETIGTADLTVDWRVLGFAAVTAVAATLVFGLAPALRGSRIAPHSGLRDGGRGTAGSRSHWFQHSLIVVETALAVALLTSGGLLLQTFQQFRSQQLGVQSEQLLTFETPLFRYGKLDQRVAFVNSMLEKIRGIPGVVNAGATSELPLKEMNGQATFYLLAGQPREQVRGQVALMRVVTREYFHTIGARLREGRFFDKSDDGLTSAPPAIVNESFANRHFPARSVIGQTFKYGNLGDKGHWYTIVGVVREIREVGMAEGLQPTVYRLHDITDQASSLPGWIVVRTSLDPESIVGALRQAIWSVDRNQPIWRVRTFENVVDRQLSTPSQSTTLLGAFAVLALLLACVGLYGVLSYAVTQRTNEIGVRMALGATSRQILLAFGRRGLLLTLAGLIVGLVLSAAASRLMSSLFYGFRPDYAPAVTAVSVILIGVAGLASFIPARRASRIDPVIALRRE